MWLSRATFFNRIANRVAQIPADPVRFGLDSVLYYPKLKDPTSISNASWEFQTSTFQSLRSITTYLLVVLLTFECWQGVALDWKQGLREKGLRLFIEQKWVDAPAWTLENLSGGEPLLNQWVTLLGERKIWIAPHRLPRRSVNPWPTEAWHWFESLPLA